MKNQKTKRTPNRKMSNKEAVKLRDEALKDVVSISDDYSILSARAQEMNDKGKLVGKEFCIPMSKKTVLEETRKVIRDEKNEITGVVIFTVKKQQPKRK